MKTRLLTAALICCLTLPGVLFAQAPKKGEKKAPAPKSATEQAFDAFQKVRNTRGAKPEPGHFQALISAGMEFLSKYPATSRSNEVVNYLGLLYPMSIDAKQPALRTQYVSLLKLEITNQKYKEGVTDPFKAALAALDAASSEAEFRQSQARDALVTLREKIDALAETPGGARFLADRERSHSHLLIIMNQAARAEEQLKKLAMHKDKGVQDMAKQELNILEARKTPFDLKFTGLDGKPVDLAQLRGKVVSLYFWNSTSKTSTDLMDKLRTFHSTYRKRGFELVTVSLDKEEDRAKLQKYVKDTKLNLPVYFDGKQAKNEFAPKLNVTSAPRLLLFNQEGILQLTMQTGALTSDYRNNLGSFETEVKKMLKIK